VQISGVGRKAGLVSDQFALEIVRLFLEIDASLLVANAADGALALDNSSR